MLLNLPRLLMVRLCALALLLTVGLQAGTPIAAPLERTHGSAFSAATHEVALKAERQGEVVRATLAPEPWLPLPEPAVPVASELATLPEPRPASTGPPAREEIAQRPSPRAPPVA